MAEPTVFVVDDDPAIRASLELLLGASGLAVRTFDGAQSFLEQFDPGAPGCLVADLRMPGASGLELQERLNRRGALLPLIFLTGHGDVPAAVRALKGGALDFLEKPYEPDALLALVARAIARDAERRTAAARTAEAAARLDRLTPREREVVARVASGQANKVIAIELGISERTVELHRSRGMHKLGASSVARLVEILRAAGPG